MIRRAWRRHRFMKDEPAYEKLLQHAAAHGDVWMVPQNEIAQWWERRQGARLHWIVGEGNTLQVEWDLDEGAVQVDGEELHTRPFVLSIPDMNEPPCIRYPAHLPHLEFFQEILGHLGCNHLQADPEEFSPSLAPAWMNPLLEELHEHAVVHQRMEPDVLDRLKQKIAQAHHEAGLPFLRFWHWPHEDGRPWKMALSTRYDVDKAIVNMRQICDLEERYGMRSTAYVRPLGMFYGRREILKLAEQCPSIEITLHGEFVTTAESRFGDEYQAARSEKVLLEEMLDRPVGGVCMHGGELRTNATVRSRDAVEQAGFTYETFYRNRYYLPLHIPDGEAVRKGLSIGQHYADINVELTAEYSDILARNFIEKFEEASAAGGVFVPVLHPLYFEITNYSVRPLNLWRVFCYLPRFFAEAIRMKRGQLYYNRRPGERD